MGVTPDQTESHDQQHLRRFVAMSDVSVAGQTVIGVKHHLRPIAVSGLRNLWSVCVTFPAVGCQRPNDSRKLLNITPGPLQGL
jgi:hypothetical protein